MKRYVMLALSMLLTVSLILSGCGTKTDDGSVDTSSTPAQSPGPGTTTTTGNNQPAITLGVFTSLTGSLASTGRQVEAGVKQAAMDWQAKTGQEVKVIVEDDTSTPDGAKAAFDRVMAQKPTVAIAPVTLLASSLDAYQNAKVPILFCWGKRPDSGDNWMFRICTDNVVEVPQLMANYAKELGSKKPAFLYPTAVPSWSSAFEKQGLPFAITKTYKSDADLIAALNDIKAAGADLIVSPTLAADAVKLTVAAKQNNLNIPILGGTPYASGDYGKPAGAAKDGVNLLANSFIGLDNESKPFVDSVAKNFPDVQVSSNVGAYYDGVMIALTAIQKAGSTDPAKIRDAIIATKGYNGVVGTYNFDSSGDGKHSMVAGRWQGDTLTKLKTVNLK